jgi:hypothetical protein
MTHGSFLSSTLICLGYDSRSGRTNVQKISTGNRLQIYQKELLKVGDYDNEAISTYFPNLDSLFQ